MWQGSCGKGQICPAAGRHDLRWPAPVLLHQFYGIYDLPGLEGGSSALRSATRITGQILDKTPGQGAPAPVLLHQVYEAVAAWLVQELMIMWQGAPAPVLLHQVYEVGLH
jgi:hypothetical protein